jgi:hypothetical protein
VCPLSFARDARVAVWRVQARGEERLGLARCGLPSSPASGWVGLCVLTSLPIPAESELALPSSAPRHEEKPTEVSATTHQPLRAVRRPKLMAIDRRRPLHAARSCARPVHRDWGRAVRRCEAARGATGGGEAELINSNPQQKPCLIRVVPFF